VNFVGNAGPGRGGMLRALAARTVMSCLCLGVCVFDAGTSWATTGTTPQLILLTTASPSLPHPGSTATVSAASNFDLPITLTNETPSVCNLAVASSNNITFVGVVTMTAVGNCSIQATQSGNATYAPATAGYSVNVTPGTVLLTQIIQVGPVSPIPGMDVGGSEVVTATATSGNTVAISAGPASVCYISGTFGELIPIGVGTCQVELIAPGNATYAATTYDVQIGIYPQILQQYLSFGPYGFLSPGGSFTLIATVTSGLPVTLSDLSPSVCSLSGNLVTALAPGNCVINATQAGDATHYPTQGTAEFAVLPPVQVQATVTVTGSPNPAALGQTVTYLCTVTGSPSNPIPPGGSVEIADSSWRVTVPLQANGTASATTSYAKPGVYSPICSYFGGGSYGQSISLLGSETVNGSTNMLLQFSNGQPSTGQPFSLIATVYGGGPYTGQLTTATGTVTFYDGAMIIGHAPVVGGVANLQVTLTGGGHQMSAAYSGDAADVPCTSATYPLQVNTSLPQTGYWWNPADAGSGFVIEIQGSNLLMAGFFYDSSGRASWATSTGIITTPGQYSGTLVSYTGGQTLTGNYVAAVQTPSFGNVSISFGSDTQATLTWPGGTIPIQRFDIVPGGSSAAQPSTNPQTGWWWNPAEGGRGFALEVQNGQVYLAGYMYDTSGNPIWYLATGALINATTFQGSWQQYGNGQTLTGKYQASVVVNANVGSVTLQFTDYANATLTLPDGRQIPIQRYAF
jgi:hypothetical protein